MSIEKTATEIARQIEQYTFANSVRVDLDIVGAHPFDDNLCRIWFDVERNDFDHVPSAKEAMSVVDVFARAHNCRATVYLTGEKNSFGVEIARIV